MKKITEILRSYSVAAETMGQLHPEQIKIINQQRWLHLFVPKDSGGLELTLPEAVRLEEKLAYIDGSVGWVVTLCAGAAMFIGYFDRELAHEIFADDSVCIAGSGKINGIAVPDSNGFVINGCWPYASGAPHAKWFTANCTVNGAAQSFIFKREEVTLQPVWNYIGLNATAGHSFSVQDLHVPHNRTFIIDPSHSKLPQAVYRYPFLQLAETTIAANTLGMSIYFFELAKRIMEKKKKGMKLINRGLAELNSLKGDFYTALDNSWEEHVQRGTIAEEILKQVSAISRGLAQASRGLVNDVYPYCGLEAAHTGSAINLVWRNINTASQHSLLLDPEN